MSKFTNNCEAPIKTFVKKHLIYIKFIIIKYHKINYYDMFCKDAEKLESYVQLLLI